MSKWIKALALALVAALCISLCGFSGECSQIRERVLRLHVLANSDSEEDQQLKLKVRDTVVETAAGLFDTVTDKDGAIAQAEQMLPMPQASMRIIRTSIMPVQPSMKVLRAFLKFQTLVIMPMMMAEMEARMKAVSSARRELPLASAPKMPLVLMSPV